MVVGNSSAAGGCATDAAGRAVRLSAGVRAIVPVTSAFAGGADPVEGTLNKGGLSNEDKPSPGDLPSCRPAVTASLSPFWISLESAVGSASKLTATLLSGASKIPKWKILLVIWTRPTTTATMLAASTTALARVANFARSGTSAVFLEGCERV